MRRAKLKSVATTNPANLNATPTVSFFDGDVAAALFVTAIAAILAPSIPPTLLICSLAFSISALLPSLTTLTLLLLRIANANLRTTVWADAELKCWLSY
jgi:hypothetical protein